MRMHNLLWVATFVLVCGAATTLLKTIDRTVFGKREAVQSSTSLPHTTVPPASRGSSGRRPPPVSSASDQHREAQALLAEAKLAQREARGFVAEWRIEIEPILSEESDSPIAVNPELIEKLAFVLATDRPSESDIDVVAERIELLQERGKSAAAKSPPELLSAREMYEIREQRAKANQAAHDWSAKINHAKAIVEKANRDARPISKPTLQQSLEQIQTEQVLAKLDENIAAGDEPSELEVESVSDPSPMETDQEFRKKALSAEVQSALAPFLAPRRVQPSLAGRLSIKFLRTSDESPMSLGRLMGIGALTDSVLGRQKLAEIGGNRKLPEPRCSIPSQPNSWTEDDEKFLLETQAMLRNYANILVEEGLLSP